ncbi:TauD/TfdA dioxygenase family protein [Novosphingobium mangrovi (ex Hu et al. 2023)]|uniref:TauD/TfdA family dioxygenase n=1 Tax=Novosphingobium mangrovi (ex Hu et al. 2023) TaxID=2930094 RepID=A0ABT0ABT3_9SPHN|nr:TauD/TfdA family dioxygenase [Novosphingobium mangrovi (ex Hu et al. 2023)]MCJ1960652.1 TauD/TfdA family dioxygenase [Novosphingobium mangrovi (ex Hu et al. 2023)]
MSYETIDVRPVTKRIGAEIFGVDLTKPLGNQTYAEIREALLKHQVVFFREQEIDHEAHLAFGQAFGKFHTHSAVKGLPDHPHIVQIHADADSKYIAGDNWHSDLSCDPEPPMGSILYMHTMPEDGGDTLFSSMTAAYEALSEPMKRFLEPLTAVHDANPVYKAIFPDIDKQYECNTHPVIRTHPETGRKLLFVNSSYTTKINELSKTESDAVLKCLYEHVKDPNFQVRFRWRPHSIAFWDNRCTQHFAVWDYFPETRSGYRVTIAGDRPF